MNFQDDMPSSPIGNSKVYFILQFDFTSLEDAIEKCYSTELVGVPLRLELNFTFPPKQVIGLIVLGELMFSVAVGKFGVVRKKTEMDIVPLQQTINCDPLLKLRYLDSFPSDYVQVFLNETFAI